MVPDASNEIEPFLRQLITVHVLLRQIDAEGVIFRLVPAGHNIQAQPSVTELIGSRKLLRRHQRMNKGCMYRRKNIDPLGMGKKAGGPSERFQHTPVEISFTAVTDPAGNRQHKFNPGIVRKLREPDIVLPRVHPALRHFGHSHPTGAIRGEKPELQFVVIQNRRLFFPHFYLTRCLMKSLKRDYMRLAVLRTGKQLAHGRCQYGVHVSRRIVWTLN